jgi:hypothetical protein
MRTLTWLAPAAILLACGGSSSTEHSDSTDSVPASATTVTASSEPSKKDYTFYNDGFLQKPLNTDLTDTKVLDKLFADYPNPYIVYFKDDGSVWYHHINTLGPLAMESFYFPDEKRLYIDYVTTNEESLVFANGIRVGMSRTDFVSVFKLDVARANDSERFVINSDSTLNEATFEFDGETLAKVSLTYNYDASNPHPKTLYDLADSWTSIIINEGEGQTEMFLACDYKLYNLGTDGGPRMSKINTLIIKQGEETRTDSVTSIVRTDDGFIINTRDASNAWKPGKLRLVFLEDDWSVATWNDRPFIISSLSEMIMEEPCDDGGD